MRSQQPEYYIWKGMKKRCVNPACRSYHNYGGRGIKVCDEWLHDFAAFLAHVGPRPTPKHSIDRWPNNDGDYEPGNVRWATQREQARNSRMNRKITARGETLLLIQWAERTGLTEDCIYQRVYSLGWSEEDAVTIPSLRHNIGRPSVRGSRNKWAVLTEEKVKQIRQERAAGVMLKDIAARFGVQTTTVHAVVHRRSWAHVP